MLFKVSKPLGMLNNSTPLKGTKMVLLDVANIKVFVCECIC